LRAVVWLIFWEDYTIKAVSELLAISRRTVRNRLDHALAVLRRVLEDEQEVSDGASA
jgi:DNA-directed RNA polymerase specialized sigma24 family protein